LEKKALFLLIFALAITPLVEWLNLASVLPAGYCLILKVGYKEFTEM